MTFQAGKFKVHLQCIGGRWEEMKSKRKSLKKKSCKTGEKTISKRVVTGDGHVDGGEMWYCDKGRWSINKAGKKKTCQSGKTINSVWGHGKHYCNKGRWIKNKSAKKKSSSDYQLKVPMKYDAVPGNWVIGKPIG